MWYSKVFTHVHTYISTNVIEIGNSNGTTNFQTRDNTEKLLSTSTRPGLNPGPLKLRHHGNDEQATRPRNKSEKILFHKIWVITHRCLRGTRI